MKDHAVKINIMELTLVFLGLKLLRAHIEKALPDDPDAVRLCDDLADKLSDQTTEWEDPSLSELTYISGVHNIMDEFESKDPEEKRS